MIKDLAVGGSDYSPGSVIEFPPPIKNITVSDVLRIRNKTTRTYLVINIIIGAFNLSLLAYNLIKVFG